MKRLGLLAALLLLALVLPASAASEVNINETTGFSYTVPSSDLTVYQVNLYNLQPGLTNLSLDSYGEPWFIAVNCTKPYGALGWWVFAVDVTYPNGTTISADPISTLQPFALDYDLRLQYATGDIDWIFDIDVYVTLLPQTVRFDTGTLVTEYILFSSVEGESEAPFDARIYLGNSQDIQDIKDHNPLAQFNRTIGSVFSWTWEMVLAFIEMIPVVGPYFAGTLDLVAIVLGELFWYLDFFLIKEPEVTVMFIETFIIGEAVIASKGGARGIVFLLRRVLDNHIRAYQFFVNLVRLMVDIVLAVINTVSSIVNALKPV